MLTQASQVFIDLVVKFYHQNFDKPKETTPEQCVLLRGENQWQHSQRNNRARCLLLNVR